MALAATLTRLIANYGSKKSLGSKLRRKRIAPLRSMIESAYHAYGFVNIIDIGGTEVYWQVIGRQYLRQFNVSITIANLEVEGTPVDPSIFTFAAADGCQLSQFRNGQFHIAHSNSVLEHVGDWSRMVAFGKELARVSQAYFVQTPNYWFPVEPHCMTPFFHWLPKPTRVWLMLHFDLGFWKRAETVDEAVRIVEHARLLNKKMVRALFPDARVIMERFMCLPKSLIAIKMAD